VKDIKKIGRNVINLQIRGLNKLKKKIPSSFVAAVDSIAKCQSKVILIGVGKSGLIASKIAATFSSVGVPSFSISANDCSHGDLGSITKKDVLILLSNSGNSIELKNIIEYANKHRIKLISIVSKKKSILYKSSDIKLLLPNENESGFGMVPTTSTTLQLALGDALAIAAMTIKKFTYLDFKRYHPSGSLGLRLKTVEDLMLTKKQIPFISEDETLNNGLKIINKKKLGLLVAINKKKITSGILTDGDLKRIVQKKNGLFNDKIKKYMSKKPISVEKNTLAVKALKIMNENKITSLCVYEKLNKRKTIGIIHIHNILSSNIG